MSNLPKEWGPIHHRNETKFYFYTRDHCSDEVLFKTLAKAPDYTIERGFCTVKDCSKYLWHDTPLCKEHAYDIWKKVEVSKDLDERYVDDDYVELTQSAEERYQEALEEQRLNDEALRAEWRRQAEEQERVWNSKHRPGHIYYLEVGAHIKIGFSTYVPERLKSYPPDSKLLAQHPGTPLMEQRIHHKFLMHLAHGKEWFTPCAEITEHIQGVHEEFPKHNKNLIA